MIFFLFFAHVSRIAVRRSLFCLADKTKIAKFDEIMLDFCVFWVVFGVFGVVFGVFGIVLGVEFGVFCVETFGVTKYWTPTTFDCFFVFNNSEVCQAAKKPNPRAKQVNVTDG